MRNAMWVGGGITGMGEIPMLGVKEKGLAKVIRDIFSNDEKGFFYDPNDLSTMYQDAAGTNPVTAVGQPVGLILDKSKGLIKSEINRDVNFDNPSSWSGQSSKISVSGGLISCNSTTNVRVIQSGVSVSANTRYVMEIDVVSYTRGDPFILCGGVEVPIPKSVGKHIISFTTKTTGAILGVYTGKINVGGEWAASSLSLTSIDGNHAYQSTSAARPILGTELVVNGDFSAGLANWVQWGTAVSSVSEGVLSITGQGSTSGVYQDIPTVVGRTYVLDFRATGFVRVMLYANSGFSPAIPNSNAPRVTFVATSSVTRIYVYCNSRDTGTIDNISLEHVTGYRTDRNYLKFDGVDDKLTTTLPTQLTGCTVARSVPNVGAQILTGQTIPATYKDNTVHCGLIVINRALTPSETSAITSELNKRAGV